MVSKWSLVLVGKWFLDLDLDLDLVSTMVSKWREMGFVHQQ